MTRGIPLTVQQAAQICELYLAGHSEKGVARLVGVSSGSVHNTLVRSGTERRGDGYSPITRARYPNGTHLPPSLSGADNPNWKGNLVGYRAAHTRVANARGRPQQCCSCGTTDPVNTYDWANLTGDYANVNDYVRMCRSCHQAFDNARKKGDTVTGRWHQSIILPSGQKVTADHRDPIVAVMRQVAVAWSDGKDAEPSDLAAIAEFYEVNRQTMAACQEGRCGHHV